MDQEHRLSRIFYPRSVAVVGAKRENNYSWLRRALRFPGPIYNVNIDKTEWAGAEALGIKSYASLVDIPEPVDFVSVTVPANVTPFVMQDCIDKGVIGVQMFTSGFSETGSELGIELEEKIRKMAVDSGILLVGPNCLGIYNPDTGFGDGREEWEAGHIGFISQSGIAANSFMAEAEDNGVPISKVVSMGNGIVLDSSDYLDYFEQDEQTRVVGMFLEGIRDGRAFYASLKKTAARKPVLVWKVGETEDSARATASHSGSTVGSQQVYEGLLTQCGAVKVDSAKEIIDTATILLNVPAMSGLNLGLYSISGGRATQMANYFSKQGFKIPLLSEISQVPMKEQYESPMINYNNPIESTSFNRLEEFAANVLDGLDQAEEIDAIVHEWSPQIGPTESEDAVLREARLATMLSFAQRATKPYVVIIAERYPEAPADVLSDISKRLLDAGVPVIDGVERGAKALRNAYQYLSFRADVGTE
ncbi:MAG: hypothetical protein FI725_05885 [SAR202 cluster bacterium]|mgnify:CR=1 FL=1|nr:hypothetical protein [SAR202 cluster bacterium]|tara:strand:- start:2609 stop:4036 length:1428 start_codon:yes stop_codon:yes gene_type:complete